MIYSRPASVVLQRFEPQRTETDDGGQSRVVPEHEDDAPVWTDLVLRLSKAAYVSIAAIRGRTRGAGNEVGPRL